MSGQFLFSNQGSRSAGFGVVNYNYDVTGRLNDNGASLAFTGNLGDGVTRTYARGLQYDAASRMQAEQYGTTTPLYRKLHYNVRGQLYDMRLSTQSWQAAEWDWNRGGLINYYSQHDIEAVGNATRGLSGADNNGNLRRSEMWIPTDANASYDGVNGAGSYAMSQGRYEYDALNRLSAVNEYQNGQTLAFVQAYDYDRFGNRTINQAGTTGNITRTLFTVDATTNRLGVPSGQAGALTYDSAGNQTSNTYNPTTSAVNFTYDAENRMTETKNGLNQTVSQYVYDADGRRVRRLTDGQWVWQVSGIDGELLAEYGARSAATNPQQEYGYRNGELLVRGGADTSVQWLIADQLGTPRMVADGSGSLTGIKRHDYLPFGEEVGAGVGGRTTGQGYGQVDSVRQKFTGYEHDDETGLDYAQARYYSSAQGRFNSIDPLAASAIVSNPQSFNRYSYVLNNPLRYVDPDGLDAQDPWGGLDDRTKKLLAAKLTTVKDAGSPTKDELKAAGVAFNQLTQVSSDGKLDVEATNTKIASVQNFVDALSSDSRVWEQVQSIQEVSIQQGNGNQGDITFTVKDREAFNSAILSTKDASGYNRFTSLTTNDGLRELGYGVTDPSMHIRQDDSRPNGAYAHWDPSTGLTRPTKSEIALDVLGGPLVETVRRGSGALAHEVLSRPSTERVSRYLQQQGLVPRH